MPHHTIRRKDRSLNAEEAMHLLEQGEYCIVATSSATNQPYAFPVSYIYYNNTLYFHCAHEGHKIENFKENPQCSAVVVGKTQPIYEKGFTTFYESTIVFGHIAEIIDATKKTEILTKLALKYLPDHMDKAEHDIAKSLERTAVYAITIEKVTGKVKR